MRSSAGVRVRAAATADVGRLLEIAGEAAEASQWTRAEYEKYVAQPKEEFFQRCLLVAVCEAGVEGFAAGGYLDGDDAAMLENLAVAAGARRTGVGKALCCAVMEWARGLDAGGLSLEVRESNAAARALYAGMRFVEDGRREKYYRDPDEDGVLMSLRF